MPCRGPGRGVASTPLLPHGGAGGKEGAASHAKQAPRSLIARPTGIGRGAACGMCTRAASWAR